MLCLIQSGKNMSYRYGNREQISFLPPSVDEYIGEQDPVHAYDVFIDALDFNDLGIDLSENQVGNSEYDPVSMLKLLVYGYSYGWRSSRRLERATHHNLSFVWLLGGLRPDHKTISNFRRSNRKALKEVLKQCARLCVRLDLIKGNTLFVDGTKMRANASLRHTWSQERCKKKLDQVDARIDEILDECDRIDTEELNDSSLVSLRKELRDKKKLRDEIQTILNELKTEKKASINTVDPDCVPTKSTHGSYAGYNAHIVADEENGLIVSCEAVSSGNDQNELSGQIKQANENLEKECDVAVADAGYSSLEDLDKVDNEGIEVIIPLQRQTDTQEGFIYNEDKDSYTCPEGHELSFWRIDKDRKRRRYRISDKKLCRQCSRFGTCTKSQRGRTVGRSFYEELAQKIEQNYHTEKSQQIYKLRQQRVELPFGHIRRNLNANAFLLRGRKGANAELSLLSTCFNITRMISILGIEMFKLRLAT